MEIQKQTVLIVDDVPANIEMLSNALGTEYEVLFATSGQEALDIAFDRIPDLILLDVVMPVMNGYEVCVRLKADPRTQPIPVIFITSMDQEEDETKGLQIGAIDYLTKPISPPIVKIRVRNHLELKRYRDFLENLSATDGLTGISNRRRFDEIYEREWRQAMRSQSPLSLILMDIDFFKEFNDHYGHLAGDDCLRLIARKLAECTRRPADLVARYGGEEFVCILPNTPVDGAVLVATQIREKVNGLNIAHAYSSVAHHVTLSMGVAARIPVAGQSAFDLIHCVDELLYAAKGNGRNQIRSELGEMI